MKSDPLRAEKNKEFFARFVKMMIIVAAQNSIVLGVNLADNVMLGKYADEVGLSAVAIANQIQFLLQMIVNGLGEGMVIVSSRFWGKKETEGMNRVLAICLKIGLAVAALMTAVMFFFNGFVYSLFSPDTAIAAQGAGYVKIVCFTYLPFCLSTLLLSSLRSSGQVRIGVGVSVAALLTNISLNYLLIFGKLGFPELGIPGAAIATLISRWVELIVTVVYIVFVEKKVGYRLRLFRGFDRGIYQELSRVGTPVLMVSLLWGVAMGVQSAILGNLEGGDVVMAANSIATTVFQFISVFAYATGSAATVVIGNSIGQGELDYLRERSKMLQWFFLIVGFVTGALLWWLARPITSIYNVTGETIAMSENFIRIQAVTVVGTAYQVSVLSGIVRAGGDTKFQMFNDIVFMWGIVLPSSFLCAYVFKLDPFWVFICLKADQILKCAVAFVKVNSFNWLRIDGKKVPIPYAAGTSVPEEASGMKGALRRK